MGNEAKGNMVIQCVGSDVGPHVSIAEQDGSCGRACLQVSLSALVSFLTEFFFLLWVSFPIWSIMYLKWSFMAVHALSESRKPEKVWMNDW